MSILSKITGESFESIENRYIDENDTNSEVAHRIVS